MALVTLLGVGLLVATAGCGPSLRGTASAERVRAVVEREAVAFDVDAPPVALVERLAAHRVVVVGEYHGITGHQDVVGALVVALHAHGTRTLLLEYPHAYGWVLDAYAQGADFELDPAASATYGTLLESVRRFNATLPVEERVRVVAIDVNPRDEDALPPLRGLMFQLGHPQVLTGAVEAIEAGAPRADALRGLAATLSADADELRATWGEQRFLAVQDIVEAELRSIEVRSTRSERARSAARELAMQAFVERVAERRPGGLLINVGAYHAQKTSRDGTVDVWLAEALARPDAAPSGSVYSLVVVPASGEKRFGDRVRAFDVASESPPNELLRLLQAVVGARHVFLPLEDPLFVQERVVVNYLPRLDTEPPAGVYDGLVLLPEVRAVER